MRYEIYSRITIRGRRWFWRLRAVNHEIIASGEGYRNKDDAEDAISLVQSSSRAPVVERV
jgi:uncharacterized protein YegP (UPF0339 family)